MNHGLQTAEVPNSTQVPNVLFTKLLPELSSAELRAYMYICYHTFGYGKTADAISYEQFLSGQVTTDGRIMDRGCGIKNRTALSQALQSLQEKGLIVARHEHDGHGHRRASTFALVLSGDEAPLAQAAGAPEYQNRYSGQSIKTGTQEAQSIKTDTLARVSKPVLTVPSSNKTGSNSPMGSNNKTGSNTSGVASCHNNPGDDRVRAEALVDTTSARAREAPIPLRQEEPVLDPLEQEPWLEEMTDVIHRRTGVYANREHLKAWKVVLAEQLKGTTEQQRDDFLAYIFDDPQRYLEERRNANEVLETLREDGAKWNAQQRPREKKRARAPLRSIRAIPSAADIAAQKDPGPSCTECKKIAGARHDEDCQFAGQVVGRERKTS